MATAAIEKAFSPPQVSDLHRTRDERHELAMKIQTRIRKVKTTRDKVGKNWEEFQLKAVHVSTILLVPIQALRDGGWLDYKLSFDVLLGRLEQMASLLKHYFTELREIDDDPKFESPGTTQSVSEKERCCKREDNKCLFTGMAQGEVAHILPFTWNDIEGAGKTTRAVIGALHAFFSDDLITELHGLVADPADPGSSDKWWNMIYMNAQLHTLWGTAGFGLYCSDLQPHIDPGKAENVDTEYEWDITVQFHWLQHQDAKPTDRIVLEGNDNEFIMMTDDQIKFEKARSEPSNNSQGNSHIDAMVMDIRATVISGNEFTLTMPKDDAFKCKKMLDVQWNIARIAAMCGAAEHPELLPDLPDYYYWN